MQRITSLWKSSLGGKIIIVLGSLLASCLACVGFGALLPDSPAPTPAPTIASTNTISATQILSTQIISIETQAPSTTVAFPTVSFIDYPRVATARFQTLQGNIVELSKIHNEFTADINVSKNNDWYFHANAILFAVTAGADELASMIYFPPQYAAFHTKMVVMSQEGKTLADNYTLALDHQDTTALNNATVSLGTIITYLNSAGADLNQPAPTQAATATAVLAPTATIVYVQPTAASTSYDSNGDGKVTCGDFNSQAAAQRAYNAGYTNLDGNDNDGKACESLP